MATTDDMKSIAETIRKAQYGKDVREAIAQGMEAYDETSGKLFDRMQKVEEKNGDLEKQNSKLQDRCQKLEQEKATHDELKDVQEAWKKKIEHVALGTDYETVEQAVMQILKKEGLV